MKLIIEISKKFGILAKDSSGKLVRNFNHLGQASEWIEKNNHKVIKVNNIKDDRNKPASLLKGIELKKKPRKSKQFKFASLELLKAQERGRKRLLRKVNPEFIPYLEVLCPSRISSKKDWEQIESIAEEAMKKFPNFPEGCLK